jgi:hypothetical protein
MPKFLKRSTLETALELLNDRLLQNNSSSFSIVVCGGSALIATNLISRTTKDVDIVSLMGIQGELVDPSPLPGQLIIAGDEVRETLNLPTDWLNNGPSSGDGGIFRMGFPRGFSQRLIKQIYGEKLIIYWIGRLDQIFFKLYAAVDQMGSYHATDLAALHPEHEELVSAVRWSQSHDPSDGFRLSMEHFLREFGYDSVVEFI